MRNLAPRALLLSVLFMLMSSGLPPAEAAITMAPPWVMLWGSMAFIKTAGTVRDIVGLVWNVATKGDGAACMLCDRVMNTMLSGEADAMDMDCQKTCWGLSKCVQICDKLVTALETSGRFPCVAAGYCPAMDEFGEIPRCKYRFPAACEPANMCSFKFPKCQLSDGYKRWRKMNAMMSENIGALAGAVAKMPKCGEPGAHKLFCINEPTGFGLWAKRLSYMIGAWAAFKSIEAIETPGGDDDRQWLSFWIIFLGMTVFESVSDVLLSWIPTYYEIKLVFVAWLGLFNGADKLYRNVHDIFVFSKRKLVKLGLIRKDELVEWDEEVWLDTLPAKLNHKIKVLGGAKRALTGLTGRDEMMRVYGSKRGEELEKAFGQIVPRSLEVHLLRAKALPACDSNGFSDPYCILSLVPPERFHGKGSFRFRAAAAKDSVNQMVFRTLLRGKKAFWDAATRAHRWWFDLFARREEQVSTKKRAAALSREPSEEEEGHQAVMKKVGAPLGSYSRTRSKTLKKTLNPEWMEDLELYLEGGHLDAQGNLFNRDAPYTRLRIEVWDYDLVGVDDFMGEVTIDLTYLMTGKSIEGWFGLGDPQGLSEHDVSRSEIYVRLKWNSDSIPLECMVPEEEREESRRERLERRRSSLDEKEIEDMLARICEDEDNIGYIKAFVENRAMLPAAPSSSSSHPPRSAPSPVDHNIMRIHDFNIKTEEGSDENDGASGASAWRPHFLVKKDSADDTESDISQ